MFLVIRWRDTTKYMLYVYSPYNSIAQRALWYPPVKVPANDDSRRYATCRYEYDPENGKGLVLEGSHGHGGERADSEVEAFSTTCLELKWTRERLAVKVCMHVNYSGTREGSNLSMKLLVPTYNIQYSITSFRW